MQDWRHWRTGSGRRGLWLICLLTLSAGAQQFITPSTLPPAVLDSPYRVQLAAQGGNPPYVWSISAGRLPADLVLDADTGVISGIAHESGPFRFTVNVANASSSSDTRSRQFIINGLAGVVVQWTSRPAVNGTTIAGAVEVTSRVPVTLTFICVAVNTVGKAFTLGYQHFELDSASQQIPFGSSVPPGDYTVRVDAVGEEMATSAIYRAALQTANRLNIP